jgi:hypothetical protein
MNKNIPDELAALEKKLNSMERTSRTRVIVSLTIVVLVGIVLMIYITVAVRAKSAELQARTIELQAKTTELSLLNDSTKKVKDKLDSLKKEISKLETYSLKGFGKSDMAAENISKKEAAQIFALSDTIERILDTAKVSKNVKIRYFPKKGDPQGVVVGILQKLGYEPVIIPARTEMTGLPTNVIWYGAKVPKNEIIIAALHLIRAGVPLKAIKPFVNRPAKEWSIEIGASVISNDKPLLTSKNVLARFGARD